MVLPRALGAFLGRERLAIAGVAAIELALVAPFLLTGVLGVGELGITIFRQTQVGFAAQAGVDYAIAHGFDAINIPIAVQNATKPTPDFAIIASPPPDAPCQFCGCASATGVSPVTTCALIATCTAVCSSGKIAGTYIKVSSQAQFPPIIPNPWQTNPVTLTAQAIARIQ